MRWQGFMLVVICSSVFCISLVPATDEAKPLADILTTPAEIKAAKADSKLTALLKQSYNSTHKELRTRYNYWLQGVGNVDGVLDALSRFHRLRAEIEPRPDLRRFLEQKLAFANELQKACENRSESRKIRAEQEIDSLAVTSYRIATEIELERLDTPEPNAQRSKAAP